MASGDGEIIGRPKRAIVGYCINVVASSEAASVEYWVETHPGILVKIPLENVASTQLSS